MPVLRKVLPPIAVSSRFATYIYITFVVVILFSIFDRLSVLSVPTFPQFFQAGALLFFLLVANSLILEYFPSYAVSLFPYSKSLFVRRFFLFQGLLLFASSVSCLALFLFRVGLHSMVPAGLFTASVLAFLFATYIRLGLKNLKQEGSKQISLYITCLSSCVLVLVTWWFVKELTGISRSSSENVNLVMNLIILSTSLFFAGSLPLFRITTPFWNVFRSTKKKFCSFLKSPRKSLPLIGILLVFFVPMLSVLSWDLPYQYHPGSDEFIVPSMLMSQGKSEEAIANTNLSQNPIDENQHLLYYILTPYFLLLRPIQNLPFYDSGPEGAPFALFARLQHYFIAALVIIATFFVGSVLFHRHVGLLAALFLASSKLFLHFSLFTRPDIPLVFIGALLILLLALAQKGRLSGHPYFFYGILVGLGMSLKPYALFYVLPIAVTLLLNSFRKKKGLSLLHVASILIRKASAVFSGTFVAYHFGRFYYSLHTTNFGADFVTAVEHSTSGNLGRYPSVGMGLFQRLSFSLELLQWWSGIVFVVVALVSIVFLFLLLLRRKSHYAALLLLVSIVPLFAFLGIQLVQNGKFVLTILPALFVSLSAFLWFILSHLRPSVRYAGVILLGALIVHGGFLSYGKIVLLSKKDVREETYEWVSENISPETPIAVLGNVGWQKPPISKKEYRIVSDKRAAEYLIVPISEYYFAHYYNKNRDRFADSDWNPETPPDAETLALSNTLFGTERETLSLQNTSFRLIRTFEKDQRVLGLQYSERFEHPASWELWGINNPREVLVYQRIP